MKIIIPAQNHPISIGGTPVDPTWYEKFKVLEGLDFIIGSGSGSGGSLSGGLASLTGSLGADVLLNNIANYFDGPSIAQGTTGTWFASGTVTVMDTAGAAHFDCRLHDGTTVIASTRHKADSANAFTSIALSGFLASPAGNLRISVKDITSTSGRIIFNQSGNSKDSTISAMRIA